MALNVMPHDAHLPIWQITLEQPGDVTGDEVPSSRCLVPWQNRAKEDGTRGRRQRG